MAIFPEGLAVLLLCLAIGAAAGETLVGATLVAQAVGATALVGLPALGGATPTLAATLAALAGARVAFDPGQRRRAVALFSASRAPWIALILCATAALGAYVAPRLFEGEAIALVTRGAAVVEAPLAPTSGNVTQTGYLFVSVAMLFVVAPLVSRPGGAALALRLCLLWSTVNVGLGLTDLLARMAGAGDILAFLRTASYAMATQVEEAGFARIVGGFSEASTYAAMSLPCLAFVYTHWRLTRGVASLLLWTTQFGLVLLSTSTTAYVGLAALVAIEAARLALAGCGDRMTRGGLIVVVVAAFAALAVFAAVIWGGERTAPYVELIERMVFEKSGSASGLERMRWNLLGVEGFAATGGFGMGMGSSRASSWLVATASQLGYLGLALHGALVAAIFLTPLAPGAPGENDVRVVLRASARAGALGWIAAIAISSGSADPGLPFFIFLGVAVGLATSTPRETPHEMPQEMPHETPDRLATPAPRAAT